MTDQMPNEYASRIEPVLRRFKPFLATQSAEFLDRIFAKPLDVYRNRLKQYGFENLGRVLDAGCGFGQWALAMAKANREVDAIDAASDRVIVLDALAEALELRNVTARHASLDALPFKDGQFDAVFCYGAVFLSDWRRAIGEFARVLAPNGRLYVCANGIGYAINLWVNRPNSSEANDTRMWAAKGIFQTWIYDRQGTTTEPASLVVEPADMIAQMKASGFEDIVLSDEGKYCAPGVAEPLTAPFFQGHYCGQTGVYEIVARLR